MDDRTVGLVIRALRQRKGLRQADLAARAGTSRSGISRAELGQLERLTLRSIRAIFSALDARLFLAPRWQGAELERLLDEAHATVVAAVARRLERLGWTVALEVTYSEFGERGSIDVLGTRAASRAAVIVEVKTDIGSSEAVGRKVDEKARLAPKLVEARYGWRPVAVGRLLVMPESMRLRRLVDRHEVIARMFPTDALAVRNWLRAPVRTFAGLWFLSDSRPLVTGGRAAMSRRRIAVPRPVAHAPSSTQAAPPAPGSVPQTLPTTTGRESEKGRP